MEEKIGLYVTDMNSDFAKNLKELISEKPGTFIVTMDQVEMAMKKTTKEVNHGEEDLNLMISKILMQAGIPPHIKGYQYLRTAILMVIDEMDMINGVTKILYPEIAKKYKTTSGSVERAMRHAIEVAWNRGSMENLNVIFGSYVQDRFSKPTNSEFIALVADELRLHNQINFLVS